MKAIFDERQRKHQPRHFMANGAILPNPERIDRLLAGARADTACPIAAGTWEPLLAALGLDAFADDPFRGLAVTTEGSGRIAASIAALGLPCLFLQEGGYICDALAYNLTSVLSGFSGSAA